VQPACATTFAEVAGQTSGLGILKTVLSQDSYAAALPSPGENYTLFAPTDAAFFDLLKTFSEWVDSGLLGCWAAGHAVAVLYWFQVAALWCCAVLHFAARCPMLPCTAWRPRGAMCLPPWHVHAHTPV